MAAEEYTSAEIVRTLKRIEDKVDGVAAGYVPRGEYEARMTSVDREIRDLKESQTAGRGRTPTWVAVCVAAVAIVLSPMLTALILR